MDNKIFKNLDEQIEILKNKNLIINDTNYAKEVLLRENYFFLNGYRYPFIKSIDNKVFIEGVTFEEFYCLFLFDRRLRNIIFKNILMIENNIKSIVSYQLSKKYGYREKDYLNPNNFNYIPEKRKQVNDLLSKMKRQIKDNAVNHTATKHYINNYGYIPLWVLVKVLSFGIVSELFSILKKAEYITIFLLYKFFCQNIIYIELYILIFDIIHFIICKIYIWQTVNPFIKILLSNLYKKLHMLYMLDKYHICLLFHKVNALKEQAHPHQ